MFAYPGNEGQVTHIEHTIPLTTDNSIACRPRRLPTQWRPGVEEEVQELQRRGVIRPSESGYAAPVCPIKKDGSIRLCVDYRALNSKTKDKAIPTGNLIEVVESMAGAQFFSHIDLVHGYYQVPIAENDKEKTAFRAPSALYEFNRMPFGLKGAPATFCRMMASVFGHMTPLQLVLYMDDLCALSVSFDDHLKQLEDTFKTLLNYGLRINAKKCQFAMTEIIFCGLRVSKDGLGPDAEKTAAIAKIPKPANVKEVRMFLGMVGWYRRFIPRFASIAKPMYNLLEGDKAFRWSHECEIAFSTLKEMLISNTVLSHPHPDRTYVLTADASMVGIEAELAQQTPEGIRPVAYFSKTLSKSERKYSVYDKEFLAIVMAVRHFRHHLIGTKFCLRTDHRPLQFWPIPKTPGVNVLDGLWNWKNIHLL